jgi:diguanylate cyclase (GGDEF)-like protein
MALLKQRLVRRGFNFLIGFFLVFLASAVTYFYIAFTTKISAINISLAFLKELVSNGLVTSIEANLAGMYSIFLIELIVLIVSVVSLLIALKHVSELYLVQKRNAHIDPLTQLYNRRAVMYGLKREIARAVRFDDSICVAMLDIDFFKKYNDTLGHVAGDKLLVRFAKILQEGVRDYDFIGRIGGEEFLIVFPRTKLKEAVEVAKRFRETIANTRFAGEPKLPHKNVTVSIGVVEHKGKRLIKQEKLVNMADELLYEAKETGRNKVVFKKIK